MPHIFNLMTVTPILLFQFVNSLSMTDFQLSDQTVEHAVERVGFLTWAVRDAQGQSMYISVSSHPDIYIYIHMTFMLTAQYIFYSLGVWKLCEGLKDFQGVRAGLFCLIIS